MNSLPALIDSQALHFPCLLNTFKQNLAKPHFSTLLMRSLCLGYLITRRTAPRLDRRSRQELKQAPADLCSRVPSITVADWKLGVKLVLLGYARKSSLLGSAPQGPR